MIHTKTKHTPPSRKGSQVHTNDVSGKSWVITNDTEGDIVVINAYPKSADDSAELYGQTLQTLTGSENKKWIAKGSTATVDLDPDQAVGNLIIARAGTLAPIKVIDAPDDDASGAVAVSVTSNDVDAARQAEKFQQNIVAFPSSDLATGYTSALQDDDPAATDEFFAAQKGYELVTLPMVLAFQTYYERFPFVYAAYQKEHSYYLYFSDGDAITYTGSVLLENSNEAPLNTEEALGKFKATFTNSTETHETVLLWADGQFANDADNPSICLRGLFVQRSVLTNSANDSELMATLGGTVDGKDVIVYDKQIHKNKDGIYANLDALVHPDDAAGYAKLIGACLVSLLALGMLVVACKKIADRIRKAEKSVPKTPEEIRAEKLEIIRKNRAEVEVIVKKMNPNAQLPNDVTVSLARYKERVTDWLIDEQRKRIDDILDNQKTYYDKLLDRTNNPEELQRVWENMEYIVDSTTGATNNDFVSSMKDITAAIKENTGILNKNMKEIKSKWDIETKKTIEEAKQGIDRITKQIEASEADRQRIADDEIPDVDIVEVPEVIE